MADARVQYLSSNDLSLPTNLSQMARVKEWVFITGQRGRNESGHTIALDDDGSRRIRQAFRNLKAILGSQGGSLRDVVKLTMIVASTHYRNVATRIQHEPEFFGSGPLPPRTVILASLPDDDIFEVSADAYLSPAPANPEEATSETEAPKFHEEQQASRQSEQSTPKPPEPKHKSIRSLKMDKTETPDKIDRIERMERMERMERSNKSQSVKPLESLVQRRVQMKEESKNKGHGMTPTAHKVNIKKAPPAPPQSEESDESLSQPEETQESVHSNDSDVLTDASEGEEACCDCDVKYQPKPSKKIVQGQPVGKQKLVVIPKKKVPVKHKHA
jgi:enamine deaminase RidA (YjgF/YER057c/UK114 family)